MFMCGRLFELDPALLSLFHYNTNCGSTQDCLSSPEFLEHVTKVSPLPTRPLPPLSHTHPASLNSPSPLYMFVCVAATR